MTLDKLMRLSAVSTADDEDCAGALVLAAWGDLDELRMLLADDDEDEEEGGEGGEHASHPTFKALRRKEVPAARAARMCAQADKRVKAAALTTAAMIALEGLAAAPGDWVEATASGAVIALGGDAPGEGKKPYGDVTYADPGYREGKKRYPIDTEAHVRAAWAYINKGKNAGFYSSSQLASIKSKIKAAARKLGIEISSDDGDGEKAAASMLALAARMSDGGVPMSHGPFTGTHTHSHFQSGAHDHPHQHVNDSSHDGGPLHRPGSQPSRAY